MATRRRTRAAATQAEPTADTLPTTIPVLSIQPSRYQPRREFERSKLYELAQSIQEEGLLQPIVVRKIDDGEEGIEYELIAGERRLRAYRLLQEYEFETGEDDVEAFEREEETEEWDDIPVVVKEMEEERAEALALIENIQREGLTELEQAEAFQRYQRAHKLTQAQVAKVFGKSRAYITNSIRLLNLPERVKALMSDRSTSFGSAHAVPLMTMDDEDEMVKLAQKAAEKGWTSTEVRKAREKWDKKQAAAEKFGGEVEEDDDGDAELNGMLDLDWGMVIVVQSSTMADHRALRKSLKEEGFDFWSGREALKRVKASLKPKD